jgi:SAM-dependent methyltransferase
MYEKLKGLYHQFFFFRDVEVRQALEHLRNHRLILDIGCGRGTFMCNLAHAQSVGIDWSLASLQFVRQRGQRAVYGNVVHLPFANSTFDGIYCAHLIEHLAPPDAYALLREMARVLRVSGILVLQTPLLHKGFFNDLTHIRPYYPEAVLHYYSTYAHQRSESTSPTYSGIDAEFEIVHLKYRYAPLYFPMVWPEHDLPRFKIQFAMTALSLVLYRFGIHGLKQTGYTLALRRKK